MLQKPKTIEGWKEVLEGVNKDLKVTENIPPTHPIHAKPYAPKFEGLDFAKKAWER